MGLDMYLNKRVWLRHNHENVEVRGVDKGQNDLIVALYKPKYVVVEAVYWRKANAIHGWFVNNVQEFEDDCGLYEVSTEQLEELRQTCLKVLANPELAEQLLPPQAGFFFGSTSIDEDYLQDLKDTVEGLTRELSATAEAIRNNPHGIWDIDFTYQASW